MRNVVSYTFNYGGFIYTFELVVLNARIVDYGFSNVPRQSTAHHKDLSWSLCPLGTKKLPLYKLQNSL